MEEALPWRLRNLRYPSLSFRSLPREGEDIAEVFPGLVAALAGCAAEIPQNEQGLPIVRSHTIYKDLVRRDPSKRLVDLRDAIPGIVIDVRYATDQNFMKQPVYNIARPLLRAPAARALQAVQREIPSKRAETTELRPFLEQLLGCLWERASYFPHPVGSTDPDWTR